MATSQWAESTDKLDMWGKGMICSSDKMEGDSTRFHHATQNCTQFRINELFNSGIFYSIFSDHGWPLVTETSESKTVDNEGLLCLELLTLYLF